VPPRACDRGNTQMLDSVATPIVGPSCVLSHDLRTLAEQLPGDHQALYLIGALEYLVSLASRVMRSTG
jgi:hypothetical protein